MRGLVMDTKVYPNRVHLQKLWVSEEGLMLLLDERVDAA